MTCAHRPIRVLHLRDSAWVDGPSRTILETGVHADPSRLDFWIGAFAAPNTSHALVDAARAVGVKARVIPDAGLNRALIAHLATLVDELRPDVLHSSELRSRMLALACRQARPHLKLVTTVHGWIANSSRRALFRFFDKLLLPRFDHVILVSNATRGLVPRWWLPDSQVSVLHNALVLGEYGRAHVDVPRRALDSRGRVQLLNVGRLSPEKGQHLLLQAVARIAVDCPGLMLDFAGMGPSEQSLRQMAASLGIEERVRFLGYVSDMPRLYRDVDLVVQSSLTEGLPNVILEAAYLRVPILATDVGGTSEVIEHARSGWLIRPGSVDALESGIRRFLLDPERFAEMTTAAHDHVSQHFSFDTRTDRLTKLYEALCVRD